MSKILGISPVALVNLRRRLEKTAGLAGVPISSPEEKASRAKSIAHLKEVKKTRKKIKKAFDDQGKEDDDDGGGSREEDDTRFKQDLDALAEIIGLEAKDSQDMVKLVLQSHKWLFVKEMGSYQHARNKGYDADDEKTAGAWFTLTTKIGQNIQKMISATINEFGTLYTEAATELIEDRSRQIDAIVKLVAKKHPEMLPEIVETLELELELGSIEDKNGAYEILENGEEGK